MSTDRINTAVVEEREWLALARRGDPDAFQRMVSTYRRPLHAYYRTPTPAATPVPSGHHHNGG